MRPHTERRAAPHYAAQGAFPYMHHARALVHRINVYVCIIATRFIRNSFYDYTTSRRSDTICYTCKVYILAHCVKRRMDPNMKSTRVQTQILFKAIAFSSLCMQHHQPRRMLRPILTVG